MGPGTLGPRRVTELVSCEVAPGIPRASRVRFGTWAPSQGGVHENMHPRRFPAPGPLLRPRPRRSRRWRARLSDPFSGVSLAPLRDGFREGAWNQAACSGESISFLLITRPPNTLWRNYLMLKIKPACVTNKKRAQPTTRPRPRGCQGAPLTRVECPPRLPDISGWWLESQPIVPCERSTAWAAGRCCLVFLPRNRTNHRG